MHFASPRQPSLPRSPLRGFGSLGRLLQEEPPPGNLRPRALALPRPAQADFFSHGLHLWGAWFCNRPCVYRFAGRRERPSGFSLLADASERHAHPQPRCGSGVRQFAAWRPQPRCGSGAGLLALPRPGAVRLAVAHKCNRFSGRRPYKPWALSVGARGCPAVRCHLLLRAAHHPGGSGRADPSAGRVPVALGRYDPKTSQRQTNKMDRASWWRSSAIAAIAELSERLSASPCECLSEHLRANVMGGFRV